MKKTIEAIYFTKKPEEARPSGKKEGKSAWFTRATKQMDSLGFKSNLFKKTRNYNFFPSQILADSRNDSNIAFPKHNFKTLKFSGVETVPFKSTKKGLKKNPSTETDELRSNIRPPSQQGNDSILLIANRGLKREVTMALADHNTLSSRKLTGAKKSPIRARSIENGKRSSSYSQDKQKILDALMRIERDLNGATSTKAANLNTEKKDSKAKRDSSGMESSKKRGKQKSIESNRSLSTNNLFQKYLSSHFKEKKRSRKESLEVEQERGAKRPRSKKTSMKVVNNETEKESLRAKPKRDSLLIKIKKVSSLSKGFNKSVNIILKKDSVKSINIDMDKSKAMADTCRIRSREVRRDKEADKGMGKQECSRKELEALKKEMVSMQSMKKEMLSMIEAKPTVAKDSSLTRKTMEKGPRMKSGDGKATVKTGQAAHCRVHTEKISLKSGEKLSAYKTDEKTYKLEFGDKLECDEGKVSTQGSDPHSASYRHKLSNKLTTAGVDEQELSSGADFNMYKDMIETESREAVSLQRVKESQPHLKWKMRAILVDWLSEVCYDNLMMRETYYYTVAILDRYLENGPLIDVKKLQLIGLTCLFIAAKFEEVVPPLVEQITLFGCNQYTEQDLLDTELLILKVNIWSTGIEMASQIRNLE